MSSFPTSADEFYALRDDRTNRCVATYDYQRISCAVIVSPGVASTVCGQTMLLASANLLSRWCRQVTIALPATEAHPLLRMGRGDLGELVLAQMRDADPFGDFQTTGAAADVACEIELHIGTETRGSSPKAVFINASG